MFAQITVATCEVSSSFLNDRACSRGSYSLVVYHGMDVLQYHAHVQEFAIYVNGTHRFFLCSSIMSFGYNRLCMCCCDSLQGPDIL
jgi:hypothetical protein